MTLAVALMFRNEPRGWSAGRGKTFAIESQGGPLMNSSAKKKMEAALSNRGLRKAGAQSRAAAINLYLSAPSLLGAAFIFPRFYSTLRCLLDHGQQTTDHRYPIFFFEACKHMAD
jgi:hypothetical protein